MLEVAQQTLERPPPDLAGFMKAVGRYHGLKDAVAHLQELEREEERG